MFKVEATLVDENSHDGSRNGYRIAGKFGESSMIFQTKTIQISNYNW